MLDTEFEISILVDIEKIRSKRFEKSYKNNMIEPGMQNRNNKDCKVKQKRAQGGCLGTKGRRKT